MKDKPIALKIFNFSSPLMYSEMLAIQGDKYSKVLPFEWIFVNELDQADIVVWDGIVTPKNTSFVSQMLEKVKSNKVLLLLGESMTLFKNHPIANSFDYSEVKTVEVAGWNVLPEEILSALEICREKLNHV